jgi:apolipoprotein N-acyltransferase
MLAAPIVWTGLELLRAHLFSGMPMPCLGHTQYRWIGLIQISDLAGAYGVAFVVVFVAASLARMLPCDQQRRCFWPVVPMAALLAAVLVYGHVRTSGAYTSPGPRIALIQGSIDTDICSEPDAETRQRILKERCDQIYREYVGLSDEAVREYGRIDLMVWPESMLPEPMVTYETDATRPADWDCSEAEFRDWLPKAAECTLSVMEQLAKRFDAPLVLGVDKQHFGVNRHSTYNCAAFVGRDGKMLAHYAKTHLVPYGEYVPFAAYFPWLARFMPLPISAVPGDKPAAFDLAWGEKTVRLAPNICYESVLPHLIRDQVNALAADGREPAVLVNVTNDGWFWGSSELDIHLACGIFRAVECRKPLLIAANTGFSAWVDGDGRILRQGPRRAKGTILAEVQLDHRTSWYLRFGDWFAGGCLLACAALGGVGAYDWRRRRGEVSGRPTTSDP